EASLAEEHEFTVQEPDPEAEGAGIVPGVPRADDPGADCHDGATRCIALTFDDGPHENTPELLDLLAEEGVTATFFLNGDPSLARPSVFRRAYAEGHEIAGHNDHHEHMPETYSGKELTAEVAAVGAMVRRQTGHTIQLFRPPFGASSDEVLAEIGEQGMAEVLWNIDSQDWQGRTPDEIVTGVVDSAGPNAIVLLHDPLEQTMEAMPSSSRSYAHWVTSSSPFPKPSAGRSSGSPTRPVAWSGHPEGRGAPISVGPNGRALVCPPLFSRWWSPSVPPQDRPRAVREHSGRARPHRRPRPRRCIPQHAPVGP